MRPRSSRNSDQPRAQRLEHRFDRLQPRPLLNVAGGGGSERGQIAQDQRFRVGLLGDRRSQPALRQPETRVGREPPAVLSRNHDQRQTHAHREPQGAVIDAGECLDQSLAQLTEGPWALAKESPRDGKHLLRDEAFGAWAEQRQRSRQHWLQGDAVRDVVGRTHKVQCAAHQRAAHNRSVVQRQVQIVATEPLQAGPETGEWRSRFLSLHTAETLHRLERGAPFSPQQHLPRQRGPVEPSMSQQLVWCTHGALKRSSRDPRASHKRS